MNDASTHFRIGEINNVFQSWVNTSTQGAIEDIVMVCVGAPTDVKCTRIPQFLQLQIGTATV